MCQPDVRTGRRCAEHGRNLGPDGLCSVERGRRRNATTPAAAAPEAVPESAKQLAATVFRKLKKAISRAENAEQAERARKARREAQELRQLEQAERRDRDPSFGAMSPERLREKQAKKSGKKAQAKPDDGRKPGRPKRD